MLQRFSLKLRFAIIVIALMTGFSLFGLWTFYAMKTLNVNGPMYQRIVQGKDLVADVLPPPEYIIESYLVVLQLSVSVNAPEKNDLIGRLHALQTEYATRHTYWQQEALDTELSKPLLETSYQAAQAFYQEAEQQFIPNVQANNVSAMQQSLLRMRQVYEDHRAAINEVVRLAGDRNKADELTAAAKIRWNAIGLSVVFMLSAIIAVLLAWLISRGILKQLGGEPAYAADVAQRIADGKLDNTIVIAAGDHSSLLANMHNMQQQLRERLEREAKEKANALRIQLALNKASSNVMMADEDYNIIYVNDALTDMFRQAQNDLRNELPHFDVNKLLGANIDIFHKNPAHQRSILDSMRSTVKSSFVVGGRHMDFVANPVMDNNGQRVGTVVEWSDRTHEITIENEIKAIVEAVKAGELDSRLNTADKSGFLQTLSMNINELATVIEKVFYDIASVMQSMASGDLSNRITNDYDGVYGSCKNDINATLDKLSEVFGQIRDSAGFISQSSDEIASGNNNLSQRAEQQASSLQETASSMEELTSTVKNNADNAQQANQVATQARELAEKGGQVVNSAVHAMQEINESSNKIAAIIGVIDEIAFQTNLLALNASVEAARAGENGRGFSVVATEVRNLAQRSANAARESKALIQNSIQKVRNGTEFVNETGKSLNEIVAGVKQVSSIIAQIASASGQQSAGIEQVNQAVAQMDEITQQNAALAEQAAAASVSMTEQATHMRNLLGFFQLEHAAAKHSSDKNASIVTRAVTKADKPARAKTLVASNDDTEWDEF